MHAVGALDGIGDGGGDGFADVGDGAQFGAGHAGDAFGGDGAVPLVQGEGGMPGVVEGEAVRSVGEAEHRAGGEDELSLR
ncbi:hypothetical protein [Streptomyces pseudogriseolus]|uniref:hypothetical protein n=1 Tax=Streptomyces pseudogriseolus TaxID=36817 RepID=UPI003FA1EE67